VLESCERQRNRGLSGSNERRTNKLRGFAEKGTSVARGNVYRFGEFELDRAAGRLRQGEREVELAPKGFQVLAYLIENRERLVPKQELMEALWKDTFVTDDALVQVVTAIRRALGDDPEQPRYIRTRPRVGYQFVAPVAIAPVPSTIVPIGRGTARLFFLLIQGGYLALYVVTLYHVREAAVILAAVLPAVPAIGTVCLMAIVALALCGIAARLYMMAAVGFDHPGIGRQFERLFPWLFSLDVIWALSPLLLVEKSGLLLPLALVPVLAYSPFSQRTLVRTAYAASVNL